MENPTRSTLAADGTAVISVVGEIDFSNADEVAQGIREALDRWSPTALHVDLRSAMFMDSTGLGALIEGYRAADGSACPFSVVNPSAKLRRVLTVTGLSELFGLSEPTETTQSSYTQTGA